MSLYFSAAVWASLALCVFYSLEDHLRAIVPKRLSQAIVGRVGGRWQAAPVIGAPGV